MPELPDVVVYVEALRARVAGEVLERVRIGSPFLLRTVEPPLTSAHWRRVAEVRRVGKRIAFGLEGGLWVVVHLMIAGRLHWHKPGTKLPGRRGLAAFDFSNGTLMLTEAGSQRRASLHVVSGEDGLRALDPGGIETLGSTLSTFSAALTRGNHTLKRALTDPRVFSGIGNAYSDEILHRAHLSPVKLTGRLTPVEIERLHHAVNATLNEWTTKLRAESEGRFPEKVTAFREGMAVHGRYGMPCPVCESKVRRIRYSSNETNYCPQCQTDGKLLADRALSRLLREDWPRTPEELDMITGGVHSERP